MNDQKKLAKKKKKAKARSAARKERKALALKPRNVFMTGAE